MRRVLATLVLLAVLHGLAPAIDRLVRPRPVLHFGNGLQLMTIYDTPTHRRFGLPVLGATSFANQVLGLPMDMTAPTGTAPTISTFTFNNSGDKAYYIWQTDRTTALTNACIYYSARVGTPPTFKIGLQGVGATGLTDSTYKGGGSPASKTFTPPADTSIDGTEQCYTFDNAYTPGRGEFLTLMVEYSSGTIDASNGFTIGAAWNQFEPRMGFPYAVTVNDGGAAAKASPWPNFSVGGSGFNVGGVITATNQVSFSSDSTWDEYGIYFNLPTGWVQTFTVKGVICGWCGSAATGKTLTLSLYSASTAQQTVTLDTDYAPVASSAERWHKYYFDESSLTTLNSGQAYRVTFTANQTALNFNVRTVVVSNTARWSGFPGADNFYLTRRADAATFDGSGDVTTERPFIGLIIDDWTVPSGGGGSALKVTGS